MKPIISVKEARKLLGKEISDELTDERVAEVVMLLHAIAKEHIKAEMEKRGHTIANDIRYHKT